MVNVVPPEDPKFNGKYDSIYNHGYGTPAGTLGINCRHMLIPYTEGVNTNHQPQYDPEEAIKNGKLVQQQRARERAIRDAKKRLKAAEELGDEVMVNQTKTLLRARQKKLREFIKATNADRKVPILTRNYDREQIAKDVNVEKQQFIKRRLTQKVNKQRQHIPGTKEYNERISNSDQQPSYFTISEEQIDELVKTKANFSKLGDNYQFIDIEQPMAIMSLIVGRLIL